MGNDIRNTNSVESMLDNLFDRTVETEQKMACCSCFIDNKKYIVAMDISNAPYLILLIFNTENEQHFILKTEEDWDDVVKKVCGFLDCSDKKELSVSDFGSYWYSRLEPDSSIITEAIEQKRKFFICSYPETFEDHYDSSTVHTPKVWISSASVNTVRAEVQPPPLQYWSISITTAFRFLQIMITTPIR